MGSITRVAGIEVGHFTESRRPTGCSVVLARAGAVAGVDVRGAAPGTRETDLLDPCNLVEQVHAVMLAGGSAWGLEAATGAVRWLEEQGTGLDIGVGRLPLVPSAVLFDLMVGDMRIRPDAAAGYAACAAASRADTLEGNVGAGTGASVGKMFGMARAMKGGIGSASVTVDGVTVGALIACNAVGTNTTIGVVATDATLTKAQAHRLAVAAHDGLARSINPVHTMLDGDTLFALGTGLAGKNPGMLLLCAMAAEATARAVLRAVQAAQTITTAEGLHLPCMADLA